MLHTASMYLNAKEMEALRIYNAMTESAFVLIGKATRFMAPVHVSRQENRNVLQKVHTLNGEDKAYCFCNDKCFSVLIPFHLNLIN